MTFYKELIYHAFFPLSLPLIYWFEGGTNGIINRQYWGSPFAIAQWVLGITCKCPGHHNSHYKFIFTHFSVTVKLQLLLMHKGQLNRALNFIQFML